MKRILVADDEKVMRTLIAGTLKIGNFHVIEVDNGFDALRIAEKEKPDLMILDVMMPGMTGYEVCKHAKSNTDSKEIKVLMLAPRGHQPDCEADYFMSKPFSPMEMLDTVEDILNT